jgi:hypothetical protein
VLSPFPAACDILLMLRDEGPSPRAAAPWYVGGAPVVRQRAAGSTYGIRPLLTAR